MQNKSTQRFSKIGWFSLLFFFLLLISCDRQPEYQEPSVSERGVVIEINGLKEAVPVFYTFYHDNKKINFFVIKVRGDVQSYFDACMKCYPKRLGYRIQDGHALCRACNMRYPIEGLKTGIGSCYPIILKGRMEGGKYFIDKGSITEGSKWF